jgi:hypothetical protein
MSQDARGSHKCHRCRPHDGGGPFRHHGTGDGPELESIDTTFAESGGEVFFTSGYSAREIAQKRARETGGRVYVNTISRNIRRRDLSVPVAYGVADSEVYTLRSPDAWHGEVYRAYWPPL